MQRDLSASFAAGFGEGFSNSPLLMPGHTVASPWLSSSILGGQDFFLGEEDSNIGFTSTPESLLFSDNSLGESDGYYFDHPRPPLLSTDLSVGSGLENSRRPYAGDTARLSDLFVPRSLSHQHQDPSLPAFTSSSPLSLLDDERSSVDLADLSVFLTHETHSNDALNSSLLEVDTSPDLPLIQTSQFRQPELPSLHDVSPRNQTPYNFQSTSSHSSQDRRHRSRRHRSSKSSSHSAVDGHHWSSSELSSSSHYRRKHSHAQHSSSKSSRTVSPGATAERRRGLLVSGGSMNHATCTLRGGSTMYTGRFETQLMSGCPQNFYDSSQPSHLQDSAGFSFEYASHEPSSHADYSSISATSGSHPSSLSEYSSGSYRSPADLAPNFHPLETPRDTRTFEPSVELPALPAPVSSRSADSNSRPSKRQRLSDDCSDKRRSDKRRNREQKNQSKSQQERNNWNSSYGVAAVVRGVVASSPVSDDLPVEQPASTETKEDDDDVVFERCVPSSNWNEHANAFPSPQQQPPFHQPYLSAPTIHQWTPRTDDASGVVCGEPANYSNSSTQQQNGSGTQQFYGNSSVSSFRAVSVGVAIGQSTPPDDPPSIDKPARTLQSSETDNTVYPTPAVVSSAPVDECISRPSFHTGPAESVPGKTRSVPDTAGPIKSIVVASTPPAVENPDPLVLADLPESGGAKTESNSSEPVDPNSSSVPTPSVPVVPQPNGDKSETVDGSVTEALGMGLVSKFDGIFEDEHNVKKRQLDVLLTRFVPAAIVSRPASSSASRGSDTPTLNVQAHSCLLKRMLTAALDVYTLSWTQLQKSQVETIKSMRDRTAHCSEVTATLVKCTTTLCGALDHFISDWLFQLHLQGNILTIPDANKPIYHRLIFNYFKPDVSSRRERRVQTIGDLFKKLPVLISQQQAGQACPLAAVLERKEEKSEEKSEEKKEWKEEWTPEKEPSTAFNLLGHEILIPS